MIERIESNGPEVSPQEDLPPGVVFWRLFGRAKGIAGDRASATWELNIGRGDADTSTSWGSQLDLNGDGIADLAVGVPCDSPTSSIKDGCHNCGPGRVYIYWSGSSRVDAVPTVIEGPDGDGGSFGSVLSPAGDVNGDGYADLVVGAPMVGHVQALADSTTCQEDRGGLGRAYVYLGGPGAFLNSPFARLSGVGSPYARFGQSVANAGDVDGDGFGDVIIGEPGGQYGYAHVFRGSPDGMTPDVVLRADTDESSAFGSTVLGAGDLNGDRFGDLVNGSGAPGLVSVYLGAQGGVSAQPSGVLSSGTDELALGLSMAPAGDVNGDGYADVVLGGLTSPQTGSFVDLFHGGPAGLELERAWTLRSGETEIHGNGIGDVNGDGYSDIAVILPDGGSSATFRIINGGPMAPAIAAVGLASAPNFADWRIAGRRLTDGQPEVLVAGGNVLRVYRGVSAVGGQPSAVIVGSPSDQGEFGWAVTSGN